MGGTTYDPVVLGYTPKQIERVLESKPVHIPLWSLLHFLLLPGSCLAFMPWFPQQ